MSSGKPVELLFREFRAENYRLAVEMGGENVSLAVLLFASIHEGMEDLKKMLREAGPEKRPCPPISPQVLNEVWTEAKELNRLLNNGYSVVNQLCVLCVEQVGSPHVVSANDIEECWRDFMRLRLQRAPVLTSLKRYFSSFPRHEHNEHEKNLVIAQMLARCPLFEIAIERFARIESIGPSAWEAEKLPRQGLGAYPGLPRVKGSRAQSGRPGAGRLGRPCGATDCRSAGTASRSIRERCVPFDRREGGPSFRVPGPPFSRRAVVSP